ncbi:zf-DHHC-domain-containing protein [Gonapodya prolifera JEL478]|uniref:Palmitoyltransferase n=1 Tax=Gonapodya prolifera (strain JEL478) TaxID=1344416 RepID=A0A139AIZ0_GONPJ|nr:zf-DHHC-domain-containing protein [Gonapodya prolifera JEL478]|eukprot:KXS16757.1 zf-DHHC-domain-containing protein [Gonapodya prolifera JEL478]
MESHVVFVIAEILFLCIFLFIMLFGPSPTFKNTIVSQAYDFLTDGMWKKGYNALRTVCGTTVANSASRLVRCLTSEAHPLIQIFYFVILTAGVAVFLVNGYPRLPTPLLGPFQTYVTIPLTIFSAYASFYLASFSDPGKVTSKNVARCLEVFEYDYMLFTPRTCPTCLIIKPARSKHCSLCRACVAKNDHHCAWINNCVGHNNHRYFLAYLVSTAFITIYGSYVIFEILRGEVNERGVWNMLVREAPGAPTRKLLSRDEPLLVALLVFIALACILAIVFGTYQFYLVLMGITTNETTKWEDIHAIIKERGYIDICRPQKNRGSPISGSSGGNSATNVRQRRPPRASTSLVPNSSVPSWRDEADDESGGEWETLETIRVRSWNELHNIYDRGAWQNLLVTLFPPKIN